MPSYYVKPSKGVYSPNAIISLVIDKAPICPETETGLTEYVMRAAHVAASLRTRGKWTTPTMRSFESGDELHDWIEEWAQNGRRTYVFAHDAGSALAQSGFFARIKRAGAVWAKRDESIGESGPMAARRGSYRFSDFVLTGPPVIVRYSVAGRGLCWLSSEQYLSESLQSVMALFRSGVHKGAGFVPGNHDGPITAAEVARVWLHVWQLLADWWVEVRGGPWGLTIGGLAMSFFRSRLTPRTVLKHDNDKALRVEELALFGGRAAVYYIGPVGFGFDRSDGKSSGQGGSDAQIDGSRVPLGSPHRLRLKSAGSHAGGGTDRTGVRRPDRPPPAPFPGLPGPLTSVDVRSMYPYLLATHQYPIRYITTEYGVSPRHVRGTLDSHCVIAEVRIRTETGEYPCRSGENAIYPCGEFDTALCGDELAQAIDEGAVRRVYCACIYERGEPFRAMASELLKLRSLARESNPVWEQFIKSLSNNFPGKLAQKKGCWERRVEAGAEKEFGEWLAPSTTDAGQLTRWKAIAGLVWEYARDKQSRRQLGSCFSYLTAYGRLMMRRIRTACPSRSIVQQDTDGLWCLPAALPHIPLSASPHDTPPGCMRIVGDSTCGQWYGPKHYWVDSGWVLSGYHDATYNAEADAFEDYHTLRRIDDGSGGPPLSSTVHHRVTSLHSLPVGGRVLPDGWVIPPTVRPTAKRS